MHRRDRLYIDGHWVPPTGTRFLDVINPVSETVIGRIPAATHEEAGQAVAAARAAADAWGRTPVAERAAYLTKIHQGLTARAEEIACIITSEVGMPIKLSRRIQSGLPAAVLESYATLLGNYAFEERIGNSLVVPSNVGGCLFQEWSMLMSILVPTAMSNRANSLLSPDTGRVCASFAPNGAVRILAMDIPKSAGR